jgi:hypothetical protein
VRPRHLSRGVQGAGVSATNEPAPTLFSAELCELLPALEFLESSRLTTLSPPSLDAAEQDIDVFVARLEIECTAQPNDYSAAAKACEQLIADVADLLAATVASDEGRSNRHPIRMKAVPKMIDFFNESFKVPVDAAIEGWRGEGVGTPIDRWWQQLDFHIRQARHGVAMSRLDTTVYHDSPQSNQVPIVALLAHCLSLWAWLITPEHP